MHSCVRCDKAPSLLTPPQPRFAIVPQHEHKAFIPYTRLFASVPAPNSHAVVQAKAARVADKVLHLDRAWEETQEIPYEYLVIATGTKLPSPGSMQHDHKLGGVDFFKTYQGGIKTAQNIVIIGGGAVGVQMALDLKEFYPEKNVTLVHSRDKVMNRFHPGLDAIVRRRFDEVGVKVITGERVKLPAEGFPTDGMPTTVHTTNSDIPADLVILATGQIPNNQLLKELDDQIADKLIASNGFLRVRPTLQLLNPSYSNIFALGDIADTGAPKAARPGMMQADVVVENILALIDGKEPTKNLEVGAAAIHLTLGLVSTGRLTGSSTLTTSAAETKRDLQESGWR